MYFDYDTALLTPVLQCGVDDVLLLPVAMFKFIVILCVDQWHWRSWWWRTCGFLVFPALRCVVLMASIPKCIHACPFLMLKNKYHTVVVHIIHVYGYASACSVVFYSCME